jgi:hypothetical protein
MWISEPFLAHALSERRSDGEPSPAAVIAGAGIPERREAVRTRLPQRSSDSGEGSFSIRFRIQRGAFRIHPHSLQPGTEVNPFFLEKTQKYRRVGLSGPVSGVSGRAEKTGQPFELKRLNGCGG